jgi:hypothetical protein
MLGERGTLKSYLKTEHQPINQNHHPITIHGIFFGDFNLKKCYQCVLEVDRRSLGGVFSHLLPLSLNGLDASKSFQIK